MDVRKKLVTTYLWNGGSWGRAGSIEYETQEGDIDNLVGTDMRLCKRTSGARSNGASVPNSISIEATGEPSEKQAGARSIAQLAVD